MLGFLKPVKKTRVCLSEFTTTGATVCYCTVKKLPYPPRPSPCPHASPLSNPFQRVLCSSTVFLRRKYVLFLTTPLSFVPIPRANTGGFFVFPSFPVCGSTHPSPPRASPPLPAVGVISRFHLFFYRFCPNAETKRLRRCR